MLLSVETLKFDTQTPRSLGFNKAKNEKWRNYSLLAGSCAVSVTRDIMQHFLLISGLDGVHVVSYSVWLNTFSVLTAFLQRLKISQSNEDIKNWIRLLAPHSVASYVFVCLVCMCLCRDRPPLCLFFESRSSYQILNENNCDQSEDWSPGCPHLPVWC